MLMKLIFLLRLTLSLQEQRIRKTKPIRKSGGPQRDKKLRRLKKSGRDNKFKNQSVGLGRLSRYLPPVIDFYEFPTFDTLALLSIVLILLKKLLLLSIIVICRVLDSLLNEDINGN